MAHTDTGRGMGEVAVAGEGGGTGCGARSARRSRDGVGGGVRGEPGGMESGRGTKAEAHSDTG